MSARTAATTTLPLLLEPFDVLFFRDGRPFTGSERSVSSLALPQTVAGAVRTALLRLIGCDFNRLKQAMEQGRPFDEAVASACAKEYHWIGRLALRGPWLARETAAGGEPEVVVPVPAVLRREKRGGTGVLRRLAPLRAGELPGWSPGPEHVGLRPLWLKQLGVTEPVEGYLSRQGLTLFLRGDTVPEDAVIPPEELFGLDYRTGIGIASDRLVAEESQIFGRGFLALKPGVFLYAEVVVPGGAPVSALLDQIAALPLGGEGRHVRVHRLTAPFSWPDASPDRPEKKPLLLLTTPCAFRSGWKPDALDGHLAAAAVPGALAFSGWDLARGAPKPTRFAVPAGSVYFLDSFPDSMPDLLAETEEEWRQGWGHYLRGVWSDE